MAFPWLKTGEGPPNKGKAMPEAQRQKCSVAKKRLVAAGWKQGNFGKKMNYSESHLAKLSANLVRAVAAVRKYKDGDKFLDKRGYVWVRVPSNQSANNRGYVHEHRIIAENALGRCLKRGEVVHHVNGVKSDNRPSNLLICTNVYHRWLHERMGELFQQIYFRECES